MYTGRCPVCNSRLVTELDSDFDEDFQARYMSCDECESTWTEAFVFVDILAIKDNRPYGGLD